MNLYFILVLNNHNKQKPHKFLFMQTDLWYHRYLLTRILYHNTSSIKVECLSIKKFWLVRFLGSRCLTQNHRLYTDAKVTANKRARPLDSYHIHSFPMRESFCTRTLSHFQQENLQLGLYLY